MMPRGFIAAVQFLTRLPTPRSSNLASDLARSHAYFPAVGLMIGAIVALGVWGGAHVNAWVGALVGVLAWVWITGALHLDGLGDIVDALGAAHRSPERFLEALDDPHAGNFAIVAIVLQIVAKLVLLSALPIDAALPGLVLVPAWARWGSLVWSRLLPPLQQGLGEQFAAGARGVTILLWGAGLAAASLWAAPQLLAAPAVVAVLGGYWRARLRGMNGDCLGASIEVTESLLLLALVAVPGWLR